MCAWIRCCGSAKPKTPFAIMTNGQFENGCTGTNWLGTGDRKILPYSTGATISMPSVLTGYSKLCATVQRTNNVDQGRTIMTCAGHSVTAPLNTSINQIEINLSSGDSFNIIDFSVSSGGGNQYVYSVWAEP